MTERDQDYWSGVGAQWLATRRQRLWRLHHDAVVRRWLANWLRDSPPERLLKTDLFEEAIGRGVIPTDPNARVEVVGIDVSASIVAAASRHPNIQALQADVRNLPFDDASFDCVVSTSTLDHFSTAGELRQSLRELVRVLKPSGQLLLTLDNLSNPVVRLRNALPGKALRRVGLLPYRVGASCSRTGLHRLLEESDTTVTELTAILHCPRAPMVRAAELLDQATESESLTRGFLRSLDFWEHLQALPSRFQTGYYLAARAVRASSPSRKRA